MKKFGRKVISALLTIAMLLSCSAVAFTFTASAWNAAPPTAIDISPKLVGMMNVKIYQDEPSITNVNTVSSGDFSALSAPREKEGFYGNSDCFYGLQHQQISQQITTKSHRFAVVRKICFLAG